MACTSRPPGRILPQTGGTRAGCPRGLDELQHPQPDSSPSPGRWSDPRHSPHVWQEQHRGPGSPRRSRCRCRVSPALYTGQPPHPKPESQLSSERHRWWEERQTRALGPRPRGMHMLNRGLTPCATCVPPHARNGQNPRQEPGHSRAPRPTPAGRGHRATAAGRQGTEGHRRQLARGRRPPLLPCLPGT